MLLGSGSGSGGSIYVSTDFGSSWNSSAWNSSGPLENWLSVCSSVSGSYLAAGSSGGSDICNYLIFVGRNLFDRTGIYTSSDSGMNWVWRFNTSFNNWRGIASSSDGKKLAAVDAKGMSMSCPHK